MSALINWLLAGDPAIRYLAHRDLLHAPSEQCKALQARLEEEGICARLLGCQRENGHWGLYYYQPKWTSTHYTLLLLKDIGTPPTLDACRGIVQRMFKECALPNGSMNLSKYEHPSDTCVDGMVLNYAAYFCPEEPRLKNLADHIISEQKPDGGFTWNMSSEHGDPHTTICALEGLAQFASGCGQEHARPAEEAIRNGVQFLLCNDFFLGGADPRFRKLTYPGRYRYDVLRALELFARYKIPYDTRMQSAIKWLDIKQPEEGGAFPLEHTHTGNIHFSLEEAGKPSRFITWKALFVLTAFGREAGVQLRIERA